MYSLSLHRARLKISIELVLSLSRQERPEPTTCMAAKEKLDQEYANAMQNHPFGIAMYRPLPRSLFKIGTCGYFDDFGSWQPIVDLERPDQLLRKNLSAVDEDELEKAPLDEGMKWGPKISSNMKAKKIALSGGM